MSIRPWMDDHSANLEAALSNIFLVCDLVLGHLPYLGPLANNRTAALVGFCLTCFFPIRLSIFKLWDHLAYCLFTIHHYPPIQHPVRTQRHAPGQRPRHWRNSTTRMIFIHQTASRTKHLHLKRRRHDTEKMLITITHPLPDWTCIQGTEAAQGQFSGFFPFSFFFFFLVLILVLGLFLTTRLRTAATHCNDDNQVQRGVSSGIEGLCRFLP